MYDNILKLTPSRSLDEISHVDWLIIKAKGQKDVRHHVDDARPAGHDVQHLKLDRVAVLRGDGLLPPVVFADLLELFHNRKQRIHAEGVARGDAHPIAE